MQKENEDFDEMLTVIKAQTKKRNFGELDDSLIRNTIVVGILSSNVREKRIESDLKLDKAIDIWRAAEQATKLLNELNQHESQVNTVTYNKEASNEK